MSTGWKSRNIAIKVLKAYEQDGNLKEHIDRLTSTFSPQIRAFIREIVSGSIRYLKLLDFSIEKVSGKKQEKQPPFVRNGLRVLAYQLFFMGVPSYAAVNETVEAIKRSCGKKKAGFVNAVAKKLLNSNYKKAVEEIEDFYERVSTLYSFETWMVKRWATFYPTELEELLKSLNKVAPLFLRVNRIKINPSQLLQLLTENGIEVEQHPHLEDMIRVKGRVEIENLPGYKEGFFYIQDPASYLVAYLLSPQEGERILDVGAAPGGKTTAIASLTHNRTSIVAVDVSKERMELLKKNCKWLGVKNVKYVITDISNNKEFLKGYEGFFDKIVIDAPCSATGVLRRHPEGKWNKSLALIRYNQKIQRNLLSAARTLLKSNGTLIYSVCSLEREEGEANVEYALSIGYTLKGFGKLPFIKADTEKGFFRVFPHREGMDGFFYAAFKR